MSNSHPSFLSIRQGRLIGAGSYGVVVRGKFPFYHGTTALKITGRYANNWFLF